MSFVTGPRAPQGASLATTWKMWSRLILCVSIVVLANLLFSQAVSDSGQPFSLWEHAGEWTIIWLARVIVVPIVWWFAAWARVEGRSWAHVLGVHLFGMITSIVVHTAIAAPVLPWDSVDQLRTFFWIDLYAYVGIVGVFYAVHYHSEMLSRTARAAELESSLMEARLHALRGQLNPHFLFNTLNSISVLAQSGDRRVVSEMIEQLSQLLRRALDDDCPMFISLADEMDFVDRYLSLQQMRYSDRLTIKRDIASDVTAALVPSMILQPIVENAIVHGVAACVGAGTVTIDARRYAGGLRLQVSDTGPGFSEAARDGRDRGIGLKNTEARLLQLYGSSHRIVYVSTPGGGATVTIQIPFREADALTPSRVA